MLEQLSISTHVLSADTQVVLLLCGRLGAMRHQPTTSEAKPLTQGEYDRLAQWLVQNEMRPAHLLDAARLGRLQDAGPDLPLSFPRISLLLDRSGALALAVEGWANKGLWVVSRSDPAYPARFRVARLGPPLLYGAGDIELLSRGGLAIVGSRDVDDDALDYTRRVAHACARQGIQVVSGGARGVDTEAMLAALEEGGSVVGVLADSLLRSTLSGKYRAALTEGTLVLVSPYDPGAGFDVGSAMGRNKHVYGLSDYALIINSSFEKGGTWAGAIEALKARRTPIFVRAEGTIPRGNTELLKLGARPFPERPWADLRGRLSTAWDDGREFASSSPDDISEGSRQRSEGSNSNPKSEIRNPDPSPIQPAHPTAAAAAEYEAMLSRLLPLLTEPRDSKYLATEMGLKAVQLRSVLERAVAEGRLDKTSRPVRYSLPLPRLPLDYGGLRIED